MARDDEDFLGRWSKRKLEARDGRPAEESAEHDGVNETPGSTGPDEAVPAASNDEQVAALEGMDDINFEELDYSSDYTRFMKEGVPDIVRRKALRQLWASDPILANLDGLNEYDEDYTDAALAVKVLESAWKPGRGYADVDEDIEEETAAQGHEIDAQADGELAKESDQEREQHRARDDVDTPEDETVREGGGEEVDAEIAMTLPASQTEDTKG